MHWKVKEKNQREDAAQTGKYHENKSLMGPLKSLGAPGKYPLFSRWAWKEGNGKGGGKERERL